MRGQLAGEFMRQVVVVHGVEVAVLDDEFSKLEIFADGDVLEETVELNFGELGLAQIDDWNGADHRAEGLWGDPGQRVLAQVQAGDLLLLGVSNALDEVDELLVVGLSVADIDSLKPQKRTRDEIRL